MFPQILIFQLIFKYKFSNFDKFQLKFSHFSLFLELLYYLQRRTQDFRSGWGRRPKGTQNLKLLSRKNWKIRWKNEHIFHNEEIIFWTRKPKKRIHKYINAHAINQGVRRWKFLKKQFISCTRNFLFLGVPGAKSLEIFLFLLSKVSVGILLLYYVFLRIKVCKFQPLNKVDFS